MPRLEAPRGEMPLIVADAEVLDLAVAEIAASHDVELARDPAGDMLRVQLRLAGVDLLEPAGGAAG